MNVLKHSTGKCRVSFPNPYVAKIRCHKNQSNFQKYIKEIKKNVHGLQKIGIGGIQMAAIGILGGNTKETANSFLRICQENGVNKIDTLYKITENDLIPIVCIDEFSFFKENAHPKVWIVQEPSKHTVDVAAQLGPTDCLIVNSDTEGIYSALAQSQAGLITYGFNGRASVTASSVADGAVQVCIQRGFYSLMQREYEPQEFSAPCPPEINPLSVLGAITACAVCDILF